MSKKQNKIELICPNCKEPYYVYPSEVSKRNYCSIKCKKDFHALHKICNYCGKEYTVMPSRSNSKYCSVECKNKDMYEKSLETRTCNHCNKEYTTQKSSKNPFCSDECQQLWHEEHCKIKYNCDYCGKEFDILRSKLEGEQKYFYCSHECSEKASVKGEYVTCNQCGKELYRTQSSLKTYNHVFCNNECRAEFERKRTTKICEYCHEEYEIKNSQVDNSRFCSNECKNKWQSENLIGENSYTWKGGLVNCECAFCGKDVKIKPNRLKNRNKTFCSYECCHKYYSISTNRTDKQIIADKRLAKNAIKNTKLTLTTPHRIINSILTRNNIDYRIEELIEYYKLDTFLPSFNLSIEIQGDFWHSNPNRFKKIKYKKQLDGIYRDKAKHTYVKNKYDYEILYLWEMDIERNIDICEKLILEYIKKNGKLENYHSFNYYIDENNNLSLKNDLIIPYQEMDNKQLTKFKELKYNVA
jgi:G:T-mismatch repair DNA endonuclease (very short patch repair protein)/endogenous inhibitor of DNA gyrase (YacG/DUF329 family)